MDEITRRGFFDRAGRYALGGVGAGVLPGLVPAPASAQRAPAGGGPRPAWLALTAEPALEPELPIIDPHHHLWDRPGNRYLLEELLEDTREHNLRQTVFVECSSMYRVDGPEELRVVGGDRVRAGRRGHERQRPVRGDPGGDRHRRHRRPAARRPGGAGARGADGGEPPALPGHPPPGVLGGTSRGGETARRPGAPATGPGLPARLRASPHLRAVI